MISLKPIANQQGITLVELMIAMVIGLILTAGVSQIFISTQSTYRITEEQSRLQENARFALGFITKDVREAGYTGCRAIEAMNVQTIAVPQVPPDPSYGENTTINGNEATSPTSPAEWTPALATSIEDDVIGGTDTITIRKGTSCGATLTGPMNTSSAQVQVSSPNSCNLAQNDTVMISDCQDAHIFNITNVPGSNLAHGLAVNGNTDTKFCLNYPAASVGNCGPGNEKLYGADAELLKFTSLTYYIRQGAGGRNALWVYDNTNATTMELIEGVEDMQVTYGVDTSGDDIVDAYQTANTVNAATNWINVISAEISLLVETQADNLTTDNMTYTYNGATVTSADSRLRRVFTTVVGIRNRVQ